MNPPRLQALETELADLERTDPEVGRAAQALDKAKRDIVTGRLIPDRRHSQHCIDSGGGCVCSVAWRRRHGLAGA